MKKVLAQGFTLVELLIVIALLGVIATIVISAINPIEQANRASDAGKKADASAIVSAINRYSVSHGYFPWNDPICTTNGGTQCPTTSDAVFPFVSGNDPSVGVCGAAGGSCKTTSNKGALVAALEVQQTFVNKPWIGAAVPADQRMVVGKAAGSSSAVYVCWVPKSTSNRQSLLASVTTGNRMVDTTAAFTAAGAPAPSTVCTTTSDANWTSGRCSECEPQ
jgi:prepilin-type N-terminal cleavage/methylation domain-containing protein